MYICNVTEEHICLITGEPREDRQQDSDMCSKLIENLKIEAENFIFFQIKYCG